MDLPWVYTGSPYKKYVKPPVILDLEVSRSTKQLQRKFTEPSTLLRLQSVAPLFGPSFYSCPNQNTSAIFKGN